MSLATTTTTVHVEQTSANPVATIVSPFAAVDVSAPLKVSAETGGSTLAFGTNSRGDILLIGRIDSSATLTSESTAVELTRMALSLSDLPVDLSVPEIASHIQTAASFALLKADISAAITGNLSPLDSADVLTDVQSVVAEAVDQAASTHAQTSAARARTLATSVPALPFYVWNKSATDRFWISDGAKTAGNVVLNNRTFLQWAIVSSVKDEATYIDPLKSTWLQLLAYYAGSESTLELGGPTRFTLAVRQDKKTLNFNATRAVSATTFAIVDTALALTKTDLSDVQQCAKKVAEKSVNTAEFANLVTGLTTDGLNAYLGSLVKSLPELLMACDRSTLDADEGLNPGYKAWAPLMVKMLSSATKPFKLARSVAATYGIWTQLFEYNGFSSDQYSVCRYGSTVRTCVGSLTAAPIQAIQGTSVPIAVVANDEDGRLLPQTPVGLTYTSADPDIFSVEVSADGTAATLHALSAGTSSLTVADPVSGVVSDSIAVTISAPEVIPFRLLRISSVPSCSDTPCPQERGFDDHFTYVRAPSAAGTFYKIVPQELTPFLLPFDDPIPLPFSAHYCADLMSVSPVVWQKVGCDSELHFLVAGTVASPQDRSERLVIDLELTMQGAVGSQNIFYQSRDGTYWQVNDQDYSIVTDPR